MTVPINYLAVLVAALASYALGFLWHGPLFGRQWMALAGMTPERIAAAKGSEMGRTFTLTFLLTLLMSYILANVLLFASSYFDRSGVAMGLMVGFWNWLGFIVPVSLGPVFWEGRSAKLWAFDAAYQLVSLCLMAIILAVWL